MEPARVGPRIVIVGGGAGGLELATRLGNKLGRRKRAEIVLIDRSLTHLWKPLLHEVAAGTLDSHIDRLDYLAQARWHHFQFRIGRMEGVDRTRREVILSALPDEEGRELIPRRSVGYEILVLAVGSVSNDYGIPGVRDHCNDLDCWEEAARFHRLFLYNFLRAQHQPESLGPGQLNVAIIGAGATGVELAAELHHAARQLVTFGLDRIRPDRDMRLILIEAAQRVLPALPERLVRAVEGELQRIGVDVLKGKRVLQVTAEGVHLEGGRFVPAHLKVWAAGIKAPDFLKDLDGLETNRIHQLVVHQTLETTRDENIYALGDCSSCPQPASGTTVPPRAQAAHQQAYTLARSLCRRIEGKPPVSYVYRDYGSLVSLSRYTTVGSLMGNLTGDIMIEGRLARLVYRFLYRLHQLSLHGFLHTFTSILSDALTRRRSHRLKLH